MNRLILWSVLAIAIGFFSECGEDIEDPYPPERPRWVEKSAPDDIIEKGIDAYPFGDHIVLDWYPNPDEDISGYRIYRAKSSPNSGFALLHDLNVFKISGFDTCFIDTSVQLNIDYFYYLRAYDQAGNKSLRSDTIQYRLVEKVWLISPTGSTLDTLPNFEWDDPTFSIYEYTIRVENLKNLEVIWIYRMIRANYTGDYLNVKYNCNNEAIESKLSHGKSYRWRVDAIAQEYFREPDNIYIDIAGSESFWEYFTIE